jgi:tRNA (guanine-N7-)-methyltransferase
MERCAGLRELEPERLRGRWLREFYGYDDLFIELGCGKGLFTASAALEAPNIFFAALERSADAQVVALERACALGLCNVRYITRDARDIYLFFGDGEAGRIYINFCDPWPGARRAKRRLTSAGFLDIYSRILRPDGEIHFKTDNLPLFEFSLREFESGEFALSEITRDLHAEGIVEPMTDYERKFHDQGVKICRCIVRVRPRAGK